MTEKILKIIKNEDGFEIFTDKQCISLFVDCSFGGGYITSEDDFKDFIGADLLDIKETNQLLKKTSLKINDRYYFDKCKDMYSVFIDFETSKGVLQFVLYGEGNGYYGTDYKISSEQLNKEGSFTLP